MRQCISFETGGRPHGSGVQSQAVLGDGGQMVVSLQPVMGFQSCAFHVCNQEKHDLGLG